MGSKVQRTASWDLWLEAHPKNLRILRILRTLSNLSGIGRTLNIMVPMSRPLKNFLSVFLNKGMHGLLLGLIASPYTYVSKSRRSSLTY